LGGQTASRGRTLATAAAFTWLNPHVYLDTLLLLGSVSTHYAGHKIGFAAGAGSSSVLFFYALGYGARLLQPVFANPNSWRVLDFFIGCVMVSLALSLVL
jgi:L-lysine exporter family protein LysE/ArgO